MRRIPLPLIFILLLSWFILSIQIDNLMLDAREAAHVWVPAAIRTYHVYGTDKVG